MLTKSFQSLAVISGRVVVVSPEAREICRTAGTQYAKRAAAGEFENRGHMCRVAREEAGQYADMVIRNKHFQAGIKKLPDNRRK